MTIRLLDENTIQKIAAGEVVERPVSIVKELIENSLDAGAKNISLSIRDGGITEIELIDDGCGIEAEDLDLAFTRHATSKIKNFDDLYDIYSMGFRGEALASIAVAAEVTLKTKTEASKLGSLVSYKNGQKISNKKVAMNQGTIIKVTNLFENIPVRKKFLKSSIAEANAITDLMHRFVLANKDVSFQYFKDDKLVFKTSSKYDHKSLIRNLFGDDLANSLLDFTYSDDDFKLSAFISNNKYYRGNRALEYVFINNRIIDSTDISSILEDQYRQIIPNGKFPAFQVYIEVDASEIDINIHPNKKSIKINKLDHLLEILSKCVKDTLFPKLIGNIEVTAKSVTEPILYKDDKYKDLLERYKTTTSEVLKKDDLVIESLDLDELSTIDQEENELEPSYDDKLVLEEFDLDFDENIENYDDNLEEYESQNIIQDKPDQKLENIFESAKYVGQVFDTYQIFQKENQMILLDQHAAHERINYEKLTNEFNKFGINSQILLTPILIDLLESEIQDLFDNYSIFEELGYEIDKFSRTTVAIRKVPGIDFVDNHKDLFLDILNNCHSNSNSASYLRDKLIMAACKMSIKSGDSLSLLEINKLIQDLFNTKLPLSCPHGRPTYIIINKNFLEKEFLRIK